MHFICRLSSIPLMLACMRRLQAGSADRADFLALLDHPDYQFERRRFGTRLPNAEGLADYLMALPQHPPEEAIGCLALRQHHPLMLRCYDQPQRYEALYESLQRRLTQGMDSIAAMVERGLEPGMSDGMVPEVISTISIGPSFGYAFEGCIHFDLLGLGEHGEANMLERIVAHELHHAIFGPWLQRLRASFDPVERFLSEFAAEGLAIKFCNNAAGVHTRPVEPDQPVNAGLDAFTLNYLNGHFAEAAARLRETLHRLDAGEMGPQALQAELEGYWLSPWTEEQSRDEVPRLLHSRVYTMGNELYGSVWDQGGLEALYDCLRHPRRLLQRLPWLAEVKDVSAR